MLSNTERDGLFEKAALVKRLDAEIKRLKEQEEIAYNKRKENECLKETVREEIKAVMKSHGKGVLKKTGEFTLKVKKGKGSVVISDELVLPSEFKQIVSTVKIDKSSIRERLLAGEKIKGADLEVNEYLEIR